MKEYLSVWGKEYQRKASEIAIFSDSVKNLTLDQKQHFVRFFYHARGHFDKFLWIMASLAPDKKHRSVVLENIIDELGGANDSHISHEQLFFDFAEALDVDILNEVKTEENYASFLKEFNEGHIKALLNGDWNEKWSIFSAYELLDNTDYNNLYVLGENLGLSDEALTFFEVHRDGDHFSDTFQLLEEIWKKDPVVVKKNFDFIGDHQLKMWSALSDKVFLLK